MNAFFVADLHFSDAEILKICRKQFCVGNNDYDAAKPFNFFNNNPLLVTPEALEHHDQLIKTNWNRLVGKKDKVFILGDVASKDHTKHLAELNGRKILIRGNHDAFMPPDALSMFIEIYEWMTVIGFNATAKPSVRNRLVNDKATILCHYPMRSWPGSCVGSCHLYGHAHGSLIEPDHFLAFDVGVDVWGYVPVPWEVIEEKFRRKREEPQNVNASIDWATRQKNPNKKMAATRDKNLAILKSMGISFDAAGVVNMAAANPDKMVEVVVAVAGTLNKHGTIYTEEVLRKIVDNVKFFWDDTSKSLVVRDFESVLKDSAKMAELFRSRMQAAMPVQMDVTTDTTLGVA